MRQLAGLLLFGGMQAAVAQQAPRIAEIVFEGNDTTQPRVMLREMLLRPGDPADLEQLERSRQAVQDLGLFREVTLRQEPLADGSVRVVVAVREKYYVLPLPRLDANSDGEYAYGLQLRWSNVRGLNETLRGYWETRDQQDEDFGKETIYAIGYGMPFVFDTRNHLGLSASYNTRPVELADGGGYQERFRSAQALLGRSLGGHGPASQGWTVGGGLLWLQQDTSGALAPQAYGEVYAPVLTAGFRDLHDKLYSDEGMAFSARIESAGEPIGSDYDYTRYTAAIFHARPLGRRAHQSLQTFAEIGARHAGPPDGENDAFELGGSSRLRGYEDEFLEGDAFYRVGVEYLRPVYWEWLRAVAILEAGNVFDTPGDASFDRVYTSLALGARLRVSWFVNVELEIGWAVPLNGSGGGARFFAGGV